MAGNVHSIIAVHNGVLNGIVIALKRIELDGKLDNIKQKSEFLGGSLIGYVAGAAVSGAVFHALGGSSLNAGTNLATGVLESARSALGVLPTVTGYAERMERLTKLMGVFGTTVQRDIARIRTVAEGLENADKT